MNRSLDCESLSGKMLKLILVKKKLKGRNKKIDIPLRNPLAYPENWYDQEGLAESDKICVSIYSNNISV